MVVFFAVASEKNKTSTTSTPGTNSIGKELHIDIEYPTKGMIITANPVTVKGKVRNLGQPESYAGVVIPVDDVEKARGQTKEDGTFSVPLSLDVNGNKTIKVFAVRTAKEGTAYVDCVFQNVPAGLEAPVEPAGQ